jgi:hypothetical protein
MPKHMTRATLNLDPGPGGWVHVDYGSGRVWVQFEKDEENKLTRVAGLHASGSDELTPGTLRRIPLGRIASAVVANGQAQMMLAVALNNPVPPEMFSAFSGKGMDEPNRYRLKKPATRRLPDEFFEQVARAYNDALIRGLNPRQTLAADSGAAPDTVARWVRKARDKDKLPRTRPGKAKGWRESDDG